MTKDLYFAPKMKRSNYWGGPVTWTFKKLSYEKKLGLYFSLVTSLILKYFQTWASSKTNRKNQEKGVISWREQWPPLSCLHAKCLWSVWIILEYWNSYKKCFVRIKRAKKKEKTATIIIIVKKERLNRCWICPRHEVSTKNNLNKRSLTEFEATAWAWLFQGLVHWQLAFNIIYCCVRRKSTLM